MASFYTVSFTDDTKICLFNDTDNYLPQNEALTYVAYNTLLGMNYGNSYDITKTDLNGNTWRFFTSGNSPRLTINGHTFQYNSTTEILMGTYNKDTKTFKLKSGVRKPPYLSKNGSLVYPGRYWGWAVDGVGVNGITTADMLIEATQVPQMYSNYAIVNNSSTMFAGTIEFQLLLNVNWKFIDTIPFGSLQSDSFVVDLPAVDYTEPTPPTDPYEPGGGSTTGGGTGNFDGTGDDIDIPGLPTLSAVDTGFITLFNPSTGQLQSLAQYMWSSGFDLNTFKKLFADPMDCILGLSIVPVAVPNGGSKTVSVGNISTGVSMTVAATQYVEVDCGTLNVNEYWGAYLDYDPYTKAEIYLPYIGTHPIAVDDIMGKPVRVVYHIDILSGACTAFVKCGGSVLYEFIGQCSSSIPITGNDWTNVINGVLTVAGAIGTMVATGGASAPMAVGAIASTVTNSMKPNVEKSGSMSGTGGMLAVQTPYLILTRPRQALPSGQNSFTGYPSFITENLGSLSGYTEIERVHLEGINATEQELSEIENLLKSGVFF